MTADPCLTADPHPEAARGRGAAPGATPAAVPSGALAFGEAGRTDRLVAAYAAGAGAPPEMPFGRPGAEAGAHDGLRGCGFDRLVAAIERADPRPCPRAEARLYQDWIRANEGRSPHLFAAWFNTGVALARAGERENAATAYRNAAVLKPDFYPAALNLGLALDALGRPEAALRAWQDALQPDAARTALLNQRGRLLEDLGRLDEAEAALRASLSTDPDQPDALQHWVHIRQKTCAWPVLPPGAFGLPEGALLRGAGPLGVLALTDDVAVQREVAASWIARKTEPAPARLAPPGGYRHGRIRLGYLSSDFCNHAMAHLIVEILERHDRGRFEVYGYCMSREDGSAIRRRVVAALDHHRVVSALSDEQAARLIRDDEIDVLVDLNGLTAGARVGILRWKPAPVQATYLGFIGPVPLPELDGLFCDDFVVPPEAAPAYAPRPVPIASIYQANDAARAVAPPLSRREAGLPEDRFVFCCFSRHYKVTQEVFETWMAILRRTGDSVLWLAEDNPWSRRAMLARAGRAGVAPERLVFAERCAPEVYMARLGAADLFLDTFPYGAGTVASDAIRAGLPLLTRCGRSYASRMAARLLDALGAGEGIAHDAAGYEDAAVRLASDPGAHAAYKRLFGQAAWAATVGDSGRFVAEYEATLSRLVAASIADRPEG